MNNKWLIVFAMALASFAVVVALGSDVGTPFPVDFSVNGTPVAQRSAVDLVAGTNVTLAAVDNGAISGVEYTVNSSGGVDHTEYFRKFIDATDSTYFAGSESGDYATGSLAIGPDLLIAAPIYIGEAYFADALVTRMFTGTGLGAGNSFGRFCLYDDDGAMYPGDLVQDAGTVDPNVGGFKTASFTKIALTAGALHWIAYFADVGTEAIYTWSEVNRDNFRMGLPATQIHETNWGWRVAAAFGACPDPFPAAATLSDSLWNNLPFMGVRLVP